MNRFPSKTAREAQKARYKPGSRVELVSMTDPYTALKPGDRGFVMAVDDIGTVHIQWDNGSTLGVAFEADKIRLVPYLSNELLSQIKAVQLSGETNMFDVKAVFEIAVREEYDLLADFIFTDTSRYNEFILTGNREDK